SKSLHIEYSHISETPDRNARRQVFSRLGQRKKFEHLLGFNSETRLVVELFQAQ
ncbi:MAG: hypothetical protein JWM11_2448, partial [Planctomycetaceae bacterium]|nr:hypothetical protein [Planctomycetaceae bacterium]